MNPQTLNRLWKWTGLAVLLLCLTTAGLFAWSRSATAIRVEGRIADYRGMVFLRSEPAVTGRVLAILRAGSAVTVQDVSSSGDWDWYQVETDSGDGWVRADQVRLAGR